MYIIKDVIDVLKFIRNCNLKCNDCILNKSIVINKIEKILCWWLEEIRKFFKLLYLNIECDK